MSASYRLPDEEGFDEGKTLEGSVFNAVGCVVTVANREMVCQAGAGVGAGHFWSIDVAGATASRKTGYNTRYVAPALYALRTIQSDGWRSDWESVKSLLYGDQSNGWIESIFDAYEVSE